MALPPPPLQPEVALTAGEEDLDEIVALCDDLPKDGYVGRKLNYKETDGHQPVLL